jgi:hypothetical protein
MIPGYCLGDLAPLERIARVPVEHGPRDLRQLPELFGRKSDRSDYGDCDVEILARIGGAARLSLPELLARAKKLAEDGADVIDLGGDRREKWKGLSKAVRALRSEGYRVSIESFSAAEIAAAVRECDLARRLVYHALRHRVLPVHIEPRQRKQSGCDEEEPTA